MLQRYPRRSSAVYPFLPLLLFSVNCDLFHNEPSKEARNIHQELINYPENQYVLLDSAIVTLDTLPLVSIRIGNKQYLYEYSSSWTGGLGADYYGSYCAKTINSSEDSIKEVERWYSFDRYSHPIRMDDGSWTFRGEDTAVPYSSYRLATIIINTRYGPLNSYSLETFNSMDGHSVDIVYLSINDVTIPLGKLLNEFFAKENLLPYDKKWLPIRRKRMYTAGREGDHAGN